MQKNEVIKVMVFFFFRKKVIKFVHIQFVHILMYAA